METRMSYVAICKCGVCVGATIDDPNHKRHVAKDVQSWIREGLIVQRENDDFVRAFFGRCRCKEIEAQQARLFDEEAYS